MSAVLPSLWGKNGGKGPEQGMLGNNCQQRWPRRCLIKTLDYYYFETFNVLTPLVKLKLHSNLGFGKYICRNSN